jgi:hypothetical protein
MVRIYCLTPPSLALLHHLMFGSKVTQHLLCVHTIGPVLLFDEKGEF